MNTKIPPRIPRYRHNALFTRGADTRLNACVGYNGGPYDFRDYAHGYFRAAERLANSLREDTAYVDPLVYPLAFLYRHGTELSLKWLARNLSALYLGNEDLHLTHKLYDNWRSVRGLLERDPIIFDTPAVASFVDVALKDFLDFDPNGEAFRYPEARNGRLYLQEARIVNIEVLGKAMGKVGEIFDFWFGRVDDVCEARRS